MIYHIDENHIRSQLWGNSINTRQSGRHGVALEEANAEGGPDRMKLCMCVRAYACVYVVIGGCGTGIGGEGGRLDQ